MAIKKSTLPNWYMLLYGLICVIDGAITIVSLGFYTSNLQLVVALWYSQRQSSYKPVVTGPVGAHMHINDDEEMCPMCGGENGLHEENCKW